MFRTIKTTIKKLYHSFTFFRSQLGKKIYSLFGKKIEESSFEELEKIFFEADLGLPLATDLVEEVREIYDSDPAISATDVLQIVEKKLLKI